MSRPLVPHQPASLPTDPSIAVPDGTKVDPDCTGLRKMYDWIEKDAGKTVLASAIQTVGDKSWE